MDLGNRGLLLRDVDYAEHYGITQYLEARNRCESLVGDS